MKETCFIEETALNSSRTQATADVVNRHVHTLLEGHSAESVLEGYSEDAVLMTQERTYRGHEQIRLFLKSFTDSLPANAGELFELTRSDARGEVAYVVWKAAGLVAHGTATFIVRNGKIVAQTFSAYT